MAFDQTLLREHSPDLISVHCRRHLLQLALVRSANNAPDVKRTLAMLNKLHSLLHHCPKPKPLSVLTAAQVAIDGLSHKLVQPGETSWLSCDGSVQVVCQHYGAICMSLQLEAIYADAGSLSCDADGLLLQMRDRAALCICCFFAQIARTTG